VGGTFFTQAVEVGDSIVAIQAAPTLEAHWVVLQRNIDAATESTPGIVELATQAEAEDGWSSAADKVVRSSHLSVKKENGGVVLRGTTDPTSGGANTGVDSLISGIGNHTNSGRFCSISGIGNHSNTGD